MQKVVIVAVFMLVCLPALLYAKGGGKARRVNAREGRGEEAASQSKCSQWTSGPCVPKNNNTCGKGNLVKTRTGDDCAVKEKTTKCEIPCPGADSPARGAGGRTRNGNKKTACKYTKGTWSECDAATSTRRRTLTLKTSSRRNSAPSTDCEPTKVMTKRCKSVTRKPRREQ
jgi:hypothetical protein